MNFLSKAIQAMRRSWKSSLHVSIGTIVSFSKLSKKSLPLVTILKLPYTHIENCPHFRQHAVYGHEASQNKTSNRITNRVRGLVISLSGTPVGGLVQQKIERTTKSEYFKDVENPLFLLTPSSDWIRFRYFKRNFVI
jgi:hypothetical protein